MHPHVSRTAKLSASTLTVLLLIGARPAGQSPARTVTPANPTILVGQSQQFTANGMSTPAAIAAGGEHTCMLMSDQSVRCVGRNNWGQLGDGHFFTNASTPVAVVGLTTAVGVGAGIEHACALVSDGTMRCWGTGYVGQLGDGTFGGWSDVPKPVQNLNGAIAAIVGGFHTCAVLSDGSMRCWGRNQDGQLGNGNNTTDASVPQTVIGLGGPVSAASAGGYHTCALMPDATARCWGRNTRGQLGDGSSSSFSSTPVTVSGLTNAAAVSGGLYHTCALLRDGTVQCWGENASGQLGNTLVFSSVPVTVAGISNAVAISTGAFHSCAILSDGTTRCWGLNDNGQLGNGTTTNSSSPVQVTGLSGPIQIAIGGSIGSGHSCALMPNRSGRCWGDNAYGQLGNGTTTDALTPVLVSGTGGLTWTSSNPGVATINAAGLATGVAPGTTTITASDGSGSASTTLTVTGSTQRVTLSTILQGPGSGSVSSNPAGIACGTDCTEDYDSGTTVTLTASAGSGSTFASWTGCNSSSGATCTVTMTAARTVTATFNLAPPPTFTLSVSKPGAGSGTVTSSPAGINCGADCSEPYTSGTSVTLTAVAAGGSVFGSWSGCDSVSGTTCTVAMNAARAVTAAFNLSTFTLTVSKPGAGSGTVTSTPAGISCGADCSEPYASGTTVTLTAAAARGSTFGGWTGCNSVSGATCSVTMSAAKSVTATFNPSFMLTVSKPGAGSGTVTSSPTGIDCGADCSEAYASGTTVTLTAAPAAGSLFGGWTGCNSVSGSTCTVAMSAAKSVTATFNLQFFTLTVTKSGLGSGTVTSSPAGINCGSTCSASYASNITVTLTAAPNVLSGFTGWTGCDTVSGNTCRVATSRARSVTAAFRLLGLL